MSTQLHPPPLFARPFDADDPRIGHLLGKAVRDPLSARAVIVGFPSDEGVRRTGGRVGAAAGPDAIREQLYKLTPDPRCHESFVELVENTIDLGNLTVTGELEKDQQCLGYLLAPYLAKNILVIVLGGGHETAYGHFLGYVEADLDVVILNWDAHPDVRPTNDSLGNSGSPFRQALEHSSQRCKGYKVAGLQPTSVAYAHLEYLMVNGCEYAWAEELTPSLIEQIDATVDKRTMVSFDLDAVVAEAAPGVSAPNASGMAVEHWLRAALAAGANPHVHSVEIVEYNPSLDRDGLTSRLAARTVWAWLAGYLRRSCS
jgi:formiminoglutamase